MNRRLARERGDRLFSSIEEAHASVVVASVDVVDRQPRRSAAAVAHRAERPGERALASLALERVDVFGRSVGRDSDDAPEVVEMGPQAVGAGREFPRDAVHEDSVEPTLEHRWLARPPRGVDENQRVAPLQRFSVLTDCWVSAIIEVCSPFRRTELGGEALGVEVDQSSFGTSSVESDQHTVAEGCNVGVRRRMAIDDEGSRRSVGSTSGQHTDRHQSDAIVRSTDAAKSWRSDLVELSTE